MSLFQSMKTPAKIRRQLFWLVCIWVRALLAALACLVVLDGATWVAIAVGAAIAAGGIGFWFQRYFDNKVNIWWFRAAHGAIWVGTGTATAIVGGTGSSRAAAIIVGTGLGVDVVVGVATAMGWLYWLDWTRNGYGASTRFNDADGLGLLIPKGADRLEGVVQPSWAGEETGMFNGWTWFGAGESTNACFTAWSLVHMGFGVLFGFLAHLSGYPVIGSLLGTLVLFVWEGLENSSSSVKRATFSVATTIGLGTCLGNGPTEGEPDSATNSAADIVIGATALWISAFAIPWPV
jgi:hypothetical protein